jgi:hypothetical protein
MIRTEPGGGWLALWRKEVVEVGKVRSNARVRGIPRRRPCSFC